MAKKKFIGGLKEDGFADLPKVRPARGYSATLGWYLAARWLLMLFYTLLGLNIFIYIINIIELMRQVSGHQVSLAQVAFMSLAKQPDLVIQLLPFAVLISGLIWLNQLNRRQELVALRAAGLPARRIILGPMLACLLVGGTALFVLNPVAATLLKRYESWQGDMFPSSVKGILTSGGSIWLKQEEIDDGKKRSFFIYGKSVSSNGQMLDAATVFVFDGQGDFLARLDAEKANLQPGFWRLENVFMLSPQKKIVHEEAVTLPTTLTAAQIQSSFNPPGTMSVWELRSFIKVLQNSGLPDSRHAMAYQRLLALPILCMTMLLLAVPFGLRFVRGRGLAMVVLAGLGLGFGFYLFGNIISAYGLAGRLNVVLAAWLPAAMAMLLAAALLIHLREE